MFDFWFTALVSLGFIFLALDGPTNFDWCSIILISISGSMIAFPETTLLRVFLGFLCFSLAFLTVYKSINLDCINWLGDSNDQVLFSIRLASVGGFVNEFVSFESLGASCIQFPSQVHLMTHFQRPQLVILLQVPWQHCWMEICRFFWTLNANVLVQMHPVCVK